MRQFDEQKMRALFTLAGIEILSVWQLPNDYWPEVLPDDWSDQRQVSDFLRYAEIRASSPWWLVKTYAGLVKIGWRKRVLNIDWSDTPIRAIITDDDVTKTETLVHAYSDLKAVEYLQKLASCGAVLSA
jgi:hypothetical protein